MDYFFSYPSVFARVFVGSLTLGVIYDSWNHLNLKGFHNYPYFQFLWGLVIECCFFFSNLFFQQSCDLFLPSFIIGSLHEFQILNFWWIFQKILSNSNMELILNQDSDFYNSLKLEEIYHQEMVQLQSRLPLLGFITPPKSSIAAMPKDMECLVIQLRYYRIQFQIS